MLTIKHSPFPLTFFLFFHHHHIQHTMTTFFENSHYYSSQIKLEEPSMLPSLLEQEQQQQQQPDDFQDFFVAYKSSSTDFCRDIDYWTYAVSQMQQHIFNTTSTSYASPEAYFLKKAKQNTSAAQDLRAMINGNGTFRFNCDPLCSTDPLTYRRHRSENLLLRMIHCRNLDLNQISLMRLSKGVFVHQKWQSSVPQPSPTLSCIEEVLASEYIDARGMLPHAKEIQGA